MFTTEARGGRTIEEGEERIESDEGRKSREAREGKEDGKDWEHEKGEGGSTVDRRTGGKGDGKEGEMGQYFTSDRGSIKQRWANTLT